MNSVAVTFSVDVSELTLEELTGEYMPGFPLEPEINEHGGFDVYDRYDDSNHHVTEGELLDAISEFLTGKYDKWCCCESCTSRFCIDYETMEFIPEDICSIEIIWQLAVFGEIVYA